MDLPLPKNNREARKWIRYHFAYYIQHADMEAIGELDNKFLDEVFPSEVQRISNKLRK